MVALVSAYRTGLPRGVYVLQSGLVLNAFGNGAANPFQLIYLHEVRGIPLGIVSIASLTSATSGLASSLVAGSLADRIGPKRTMIGGLAISTTGFALYPLIERGWHAIALALVIGPGVGVWLTMQSVLLAAITPAELRHVAFAQQRVAANIGLGFGGFAGGTIAATLGFTTLFLVNAATFAVYSVFVARIPGVAPPARTSEPFGYRTVIRDRTFLGIAGLNFVWVVALISLGVGVFPLFVHEHAGVGERAIGFLFLLNSLTIVVAQLPVARAMEGRRRMRGFALMAVVFAAWWTIVTLTGAALSGTIAIAVLTFAVVLLSLGECMYDAIQGPLVSDLAPPGRSGRYLAFSGFSWQLGFIVGPASATAMLAVAPFAVMPVAAGLCLAGGAGALRLERRLPPAFRVTPRR